MSIAPILTFKAGRCKINSGTATPWKVTPQPEKGYIYLYREDDLVHFCWRERNSALDDPALDLVMIPTDGHFIPYEHEDPRAKTNGRLFVLKFSSSSQRHIFWLQSKPQGRDGDLSWLSPRDRKIGEVVDALLQGEEPDIAQELALVRNTDGGNDDDDNDETMEDVEGSRDPHDHSRSGSGGGAGPDATGGDVRQEGEGAREGGADGGRAASGFTQDDASAAVRNLLQSLSGGAGAAGRSQSEDKEAYPYLTHLLPKEATLPVLQTASEDYIDNLLSLLPPAVVMLAAGAGTSASVADPSPDSLAAARASLSMRDKKALLEKVLRSPQFHQSLTSLTLAIKDGGLPNVADALGVKVANGGYMRGGGMPLGGDAAIRAFVEGVKKTVEEEEKE